MTTLAGASICGLSALVPVVATAAAAGLSVAPVTIDIPVGQHFAEVRIANHGAAPRVFEVDVERWSQVQGKDQFSRAQYALAAPALFWMLPGTTQVIRIAFRPPSPSEKPQERAYRLFVNEVSQDQRPAGSGGPTGLEVPTQTRVSVPVFVRPTRAEVRPQWSLTGGAGDWTLHLHNAGNRHLQVLSVHAVASDGRVLLDREHSGFVLAGASLAWSLPAAVDELRQGLDVRLVTTAGPISAHVSRAS